LVDHPHGTTLAKDRYVHDVILGSL
jgi:hypothetical protein